MIPNASRKYHAFKPIHLPDRKWPSKVMKKPPIWCSVDLRDGNQSLETPMNLEKKIRMFRMLVDVGFKEIEVAFPSASETEFEFVRYLIEHDLIPEDVTIQVLTQAREHLIRRTCESLIGVKKAVIHFYNSTSPLQRKVVFQMNKKEVIQLAIQGAKWVQQYQREFLQGSEIRYEYTPESFNATEVDFAVAICEAVMQVLQPTRRKKIMLNLPATVEMATPNIFADQIEWFCRHLSNRDLALISLHCHNDRGCAVAASELGVLAGADRVEGTLFGNGERCGNVDIVTMALNLYTQGINPGLRFDDMTEIIQTYHEATGMTVHERHPYAGKLVYTAFSGSHQDAINKGMHAVATTKSHQWAVPYLPIDPEDVGRSYEAIVRINSQSGKGGVAYILERDFGFKMPKAMHAHFGKVIKHFSDKAGREVQPKEIFDLFHATYVNQETVVRFKKAEIMDNVFYAVIQTPRGEREVVSPPEKIIDTFFTMLKETPNHDFEILDYSHHAIETEEGVRTVAYVHVREPNGQVAFGVGIDQNPYIAMARAAVSVSQNVAKEAVCSEVENKQSHSLLAQ